MNCNVIRDLMPQYVDGCLSDASRALIEEHAKTCEGCKKELAEVKALFCADEQKAFAPKPIERKKPFKLINIRKAALIQSALLYLSFAVIVLGVWREASTPSGSMNGLWGISLVVPSTAFLLSLANWYFVRFYASKKAFSTCSLLLYIAFLAVCAAWSALHYGAELKSLFAGSALSIALPVIGMALAFAFGMIAYFGSAKYAALLGKA